MLQCIMGMLKLHIEQLAIYTERVKGIEEEGELKKIQWTKDDVWSAAKRRQDDEERYWIELRRKQEGIKNAQEEEEEKQIVHRNIDRICGDILNSQSRKRTPSITMTDADEEKEIPQPPPEMAPEIVTQTVTATLSTDDSDPDDIDPEP